jgi:transposase
MAEPFLPLTALTEAQRTQALERFTIIRPALEEGVSRAQVARTSQIAPSTVQLWIKRYREKGLAGLANNIARSDKGKSRKLPETAIQLIEGLALQKPPRSMAAIHRQVTTIAQEQGWKPPSYDRVRHIIKGLDPALVTLAIRERLLTEKNLTSSIGEKPPTPMPCGKRIIAHWIFCCWMKQAPPPSPGSPRLKMTTAG